MQDIMNTELLKRRQFLAATGAGAIALAGLGVSRRALAAPPLPTWVANLPLWRWHQIPNTALSSVEPSPRPLGSTGPRSKIETWNGATLKRAGSVYMLGAAGGHADYAGNEVNALRLGVETPAWAQLRAPSANSAIINGTQFYLDNRPSSTHTYYATQFIESTNRMVVIGSPGVAGPFPAAPADWLLVGDKRSFSFNVGTGDWDSPDAFPLFPAAGDFTAALCVKHPWTDNIYYSRSYGTGWYRWTRSSNSWVKLSNVTRAPWYAGTAIDPLRDRMLIVGNYSPAAPEVRDLNGTSVAASFGGLGAAALTLSGYPGVMYDEANDRYLVLHNAGATIRLLRVHPTSWIVDEPATTGTAPAARPNGLQNAAQYAPELGGFVLANSYNGNVYFMRTSTTPGVTPTPDTTPPSAPTGLTIS